MEQPRIAVIGAGAMGIAAAYELVRLGYSPVVFESDDRVGGMAATFDFGGIDVERYYHFHCTSDADFLELLDELHIADKMRWNETTMAQWFRSSLQPWGNPVALLRFRGLSLISKVRYGLLALTSTRRSDWRRLDGVEASSWLRGWVGQEAYDALWEPLFTLKFHRYAGNLSAAWIWTRIRRIGRSRYSLMREKLGYLDGGSATLFDAVSRAITDGGGEIRLSAHVSHIVVQDGEVCGVECDGRIEQFDRVISTIPAPLVPGLVPQGLGRDELNRFESLVNIGVACVIVKLARPLTGNFWVNVSDPDMDIPGLVEYTALRAMDATIVYVPYYLPTDHPLYVADDDVLRERVSRYLKQLNPSLADEDILDVRVHRYRYAQPICPPRYADGLPPISLSVRGLFAADTSYYYPEDRGMSESIGLGRRLARMATE